MNQRNARSGNGFYGNTITITNTTTTIITTTTIATTTTTTTTTTITIITNDKERCFNNGEDKQGDIL